jgi:DNA-directed RNA polymerase II subunit RPB11
MEPPPNDTSPDRIVATPEPSENGFVADPTPVLNRYVLIDSVPRLMDPLPSNRPAFLNATLLRPSGMGLGPAYDMLPVCGPDDANVEMVRHLLFTLEPGEKKIESEEDSRMSFVHVVAFVDEIGVPNTSIFTLNKEDHTLGNLLAARLRSKPYINFAGYKAPHPLIAKIELRVGTDGTITPKDAIVQVCKEIVMDLEKVSQEFTKEMELFKIAKGEGNTNGL